MADESWGETVAETLQSRGIEDSDLCRIFASIDRKHFVPGIHKYMAYDDLPVALGHGQITTHYSLIALMIHELELGPDHRVLELGTGSGFQTAVLSSIAASVVTVERIKSLLDKARNVLTHTYRRDNITFIHGDGADHLDTSEEFDRIIVSAAATTVPQRLVNLLKPHGIMIIPVVTAHNQQNLAKLKKGEKDVGWEYLSKVKFAPMKQGRSS